MSRQKITPCLWFDNQAEEAARFYVSLFPDSKILHTTRYSDAGPGPAGSVMIVEFQLAGLHYLALNGGPHFQFNEAVSLSVDCQSQAEIDALWEKLCEGGSPGQCGWLKDRFGLSWQIVPSVLPKLMSDSARAPRVMQALLGMTKLDIRKLEEAAANGRPPATPPPLPAAEPRDILSTRELPFSREEVFQAFSDPERLARWWGPKGFRNTFHEFQFQPGGHWRFVMHGPDGKNYNNESLFTAVDEPQRIVFDHISPPQFQMTITLDELPDRGTRVVWRQRFLTAEIREQIAKFAVDANQQNFDRLTAELQSTA